jgi:hypothetical protein
MCKSFTIRWLAIAAAVLTTALSGCSRQTNVHSNLTAVIGGRQIKASIDAPASIQVEGEAALIRFGASQVRVEKERLLLDGMERAKIPASAMHVEVMLSKNMLDVTAEGINILTTKIQIER